MKINEIIIESAVKLYKYENLEVEKAVSLLRDHCSESFGLIHNPIWRGLSNHTQPIVMIDPSTGVRRSSNTSDHYTQLIDNSPYFEHWPKRSQSLICSTSKQRAASYSSYGNLYAIFPYDGVKIAMCPYDDMWATPVRIRELDLNFNDDYSMDTFNNFLANDLEMPDTIMGMKQQIRTTDFENIIDNYCDKREIPRIDPLKFIDILYRALAPLNTGFELKTIQQFKNSMSDNGNREVWIGGPVIAIHQEMYAEFVKAANHQSFVPSDTYSMSA